MSLHWERNRYTQIRVRKDPRLQELKDEIRIWAATHNKYMIDAVFLLLVKGLEKAQEEEK